MSWQKENEDKKRAPASCVSSGKKKDREETAGKKAVRHKDE